MNTLNSKIDAEIFAAKNLIAQEYYNLNFDEDTTLKCNGCNDKLPKEKYCINDKRSKWFGKYRGFKLLEWICINCWDKGIRYK